MYIHIINRGDYYMVSCELVTTISLLACNIIKCLSEEEVSLLANVFNQLGDTLETLLAQQQLCQKLEDKKQSN